MKEKRKKSEKPSGSRNRNSSKNSGRKIASSSSSRVKAQSVKPEAKKLDSSVRDEIVAIILIAIGVFFIIAFQTEAAGTIGLSLSHFFKGMFGFAAYILPYYFIIYGVLLFMRKNM